MARPAALIVGGGGYFGARLSEGLSTTHDVTITYRSMAPRRRAWIERNEIEALAFDSARQDRFESDSDFDLVVNLAMPGAREAQSDAEAAVARGLTTARACAALIDEGRARRLVHFSTFHVYGGAGAPDYREDTPATPSHPYGQAHLAVEEHLGTCNGHDSIAVLRPTNMVGAPAHLDLGDQGGLIFLDLCRQAAQEKHMTLHNDGLSYRDILPFEDAISAVRVLAAAERLEPAVFNLAAGRAISLREIAEGIAGSLPETVGITYGDGTDAFREAFDVDISRLRALGWSPRHCFRDEAARTADVFR